MPLDHPSLLAEAILQQSPVGFVLVNKVGQVIFVNEAASRLAWKSPEHTTIDVQSAFEVWGNAKDFEGRAIPVEEWPITLALRGIKTAGKELKLLRPDGTYFDLCISASPLISEGVIIGAIASFIDITERRLAEQKLTMINTRLEEVATERARGISLMHLIGTSAKNITDMREMLQIVLTEICSHLHWPVGCAYVVEPPGRLFGISAWYSSDGGRYEDLRRTTAKIDFTANESVIGWVQKNRTAVFIPDLDKEEPFLRKNQAREAGLKSFLAIPVVVQGQPFAILEFFQSEPIEFEDSVLQVMDVIASHLGQVIEQKRAERKLQALFDSAPDAQIVTDMLGHIVMANKQTEKLFGYTEDSLLGQSIELLVPPDVRARHIQHRTKYVAVPHPRPMGIGMELMGLSKDGAKIPVEVSLSPVELDEGLLIATAIRDIRERKRLEEKVREKERLAEMGTFAAIFAHELANPLNGISSTTQLLVKQVPAEHQGLIKDLTSEIRRLESMLNQFRSFPKLGHLTAAPIELTSLVERVIAMNALHWSELGIRVVTDFKGNLSFEGDEEKLLQVIINLSRNAVEAMSDGGTLTLRTYSTGDGVVFEVGDTGPGIAEGVDVFELFTTTKAQGSGIGLYVARQIVLAHSGSITYSNQQPRGTTFQITLPKKANSPAKIPLRVRLRSRLRRSLKHRAFPLRG